MICHRKPENVVLKSILKPKRLSITKGVLNRRNNPEEDITIHNQKMPYRAKVIKNSTALCCKKIVHRLKK